MDFYSALVRSGKLLESKFEQSEDIVHSASKGTIREDIVKYIIRPFLPACYGLSGGEAFDDRGRVSKQLDLVVYDSLFSYIVPYSENFIQFPCESVYGNIEIKSMLNQQSFFEAIENVASLKCLHREKTTEWQITPQVNIVLGGKKEYEKRNPFFGVIFAYDSVEPSTVLKYFQDVNLPSKLLPNLLVLYKKKSIIVQANGSSAEAFPKDSFDKYVCLNCGDETLAVFIGMIINYTRWINLRTANVPQEIIKALEKLLHTNNDNDTTSEVPVSFKK